MRFAAAFAWIALLTHSQFERATVSAAESDAAESAANDGYLDRIEREVSEPSADASTGHHSHPSSGRDDDSCNSGRRGPRWNIHMGPPDQTTHWSATDDDGDSSAGAWLFFYAATAPWWAPHAILESEEAGAAGFPPAPYLEGNPGYLLLSEEANAKPWGGRVSLDTANNFDNVTTMTGRLQLDTVFRLGIDAEWASLVERQRGGTDWLGRGDCNLVFRFAQSPRIQFHSGLGVNWLAGRDTSDVGFNFTYGVDLFPVDPVVTSATLDLGRIGNSSLVHFRGTLGLMVRPRLHLYAGYDLLNFGGHSIHSLLTGVELWF